jgi:FkbM family methyltransferase
MEMLKGATQTQYNERQGLIALLESGLVKGRHVAIDGGAHVGTWTELFAQEFAVVHAFEPSPAFDMLRENVGHLSNVELHNAALTDQFERMESYHRKPKGKLTSRRVRPNPKGEVRGVPIDDLGLGTCDIIKLDIEGYEYRALLGASATIERTKPFLLVEFAGHGAHAGSSEEALMALILSMGYVQVWKWGVDIGFAPKNGDSND